MSTESLLECPPKGSNYSPGTRRVEGESPTPQAILQDSLVSATAGAGVGQHPLPVGGPALMSDNQTGVKGSNPLPVQSRPAEADPEAIILNTCPNLALLPIPKITPKRCTPHFKVIACGCGRRLIPDSCHRLDCLTCAPWVGRRRAQAVFERLKRPSEFKHGTNTVKTVIYSVFTVPIAIRARYYEKKEWQKVRIKVWRLLKEHFGALYGMEASHPSGDSPPEDSLPARLEKPTESQIPRLENPTETPIPRIEESTVFHPHLNFLWVQRDGWSPFISTDMLRTGWAHILGVDVADVHTQYSGNEAMIKHWCNYVCRTFPGSHGWIGPLRWYGQYPRSVQKEVYLCPDCGQPYRVLGIIRADVVEEYYKRGILSGIDPPWENDENIIRVRRRKEYGRERLTADDDGLPGFILCEEGVTYYSSENLTRWQHATRREVNSD